MNVSTTSGVPAGGASRIEEVSQLVQKLCVANAGITIYGLEHPITKRGIAEAHQWLTEMIRRRHGAPVVIEISGDKAFFESFPIETRNPRVSALFTRLAALHVNNLRFHPGISLEEYSAFHEVLMMKEADILKMGGLKTLLTRAGVKNLTMTAATYVMVQESQRVVDRDARVAGGKLAAGDADRQILEQMLAEAVREAKDKDWFVTKVKNDPKQMAALIAQGIQDAVEQSGRPAGKSSEESIRSLLEGIRTVGTTLADPATGAIKPGQEDLKDAIIELENEIRTRSRHLMSTDASKRFIGEILGVVTAYTNQVKAGRLAEEFLKGENTLKKTEQLLKKLTPRETSPDKLVEQLRPALVKRGLTEKDIDRLKEAATVVKPTEQRPARKKPADMALRDGIVQRLRSLGLDETKHQETMDVLTVFFENKLKEREKDFSAESFRLVESVSRRDDFIDEITDCGLIIWDRNGRVEHVKTLPGEAPLLKVDAVVRPEVFAELLAGPFPTPPLDPEAVEQKGWSLEEYRLLTSISHVIRGRDRGIIGVLVSPKK